MVEGDIVPEKTTSARRSEGVVHSVNTKDAAIDVLKRVVIVADEEKLDILRKKRLIIREVEETLNLGKLLGVETIGNEEEVVKDIARIIEEHEKKCELVVLLETKLEEITDRMVSRVWYTDNFKYVFSLSVGKTGGILMVWEKGRFCVTSKSSADRFIVVEGNWVTDNCRCHGVCVCGDFNMITKIEERGGGTLFRRGVGNFTLMKRLSAFKDFLKDWNISSFGNVDKGIKRVMGEIEQLEGDPQDSSISLSMVEKKRVLQEELWRLLRYRESMW
ncbi:hypothetical protein V6N13_123905 [Hibiscus sabdariffa]